MEDLKENTERNKYSVQSQYQVKVKYQGKLILKKQTGTIIGRYIDWYINWNMLSQVI